jgi:8-oxo-dGTP diphosphatase
MRLVVVRHGSAKSKRAWKGRDQDRPLTANGDRQAKAISGLLSAHHPDRIISSPSLRCVQTVTPLASRCQLQIEQSHALAPDGGPAAVELVKQLIGGDPAASTIVLCTHREVLVEILPALAAEYGVSLGHRLPGGKGGCWTLLIRKRNTASIKYWRPNI